MKYPDTYTDNVSKEKERERKRKQAIHVIAENVYPLRAKFEFPQKAAWVSMCNM